MSNWAPKPLRSQDPQPLFKQDDSFTVTKSSSLTPLQRQRLQDGTPHTRGSQYRIEPGTAPQIGGPELYLGDVSKSQAPEESIDADDIVKSFLSKGDIKISYKDDHGESVDLHHEEDEETKKAAEQPQGIGAKLGAAAGKVVRTAGGIAGRVGSTAVGLSQRR